MKDITKYNSKGELQGYQQWLNYENKVVYRGNFKKHERIGYTEFFNDKETNFYII